MIRLAVAAESYCWSAAIALPDLHPASTGCSWIHATSNPPALLANAIIGPRWTGELTVPLKTYSRLRIITCCEKVLMEVRCDC